MKGILTVLMVLCVGCGFAESDSTAILQAVVRSTPVNGQGAVPGRIQPGSHVKLSTVIKNVGKETNKPGTLLVRFAFPKPLDTHKNSLLFETERVTLPAIPPGEIVTLSFNKTHRWPSLFDYISHDWPMRHYEAVATIDETEEVIGNLTIAFSAYYYDGHSKEFPTAVPSLDDTAMR